jgi:hypothetical protein
MENLARALDLDADLEQVALVIQYGNLSPQGIAIYQAFQ